MTSREKMPDALPETVVLEIWGEIIGDKVDPIIMRAIKNHDVVPTKDSFDDFAQAAMEYPHFASAADIARALNISQRHASEAVARVRMKARSNRR